MRFDRVFAENGHSITIFEKFTTSAKEKVNIDTIKNEKIVKHRYQNLDRS